MTTALIANNLPIPSALGSLDAYISAVNQVPVLTVEEEQALARAYRDDEDLDAAKGLIMSHLRFVVHVARGYQGYGLGMGDLIQEGNIGLMKAVKRFDPDQATGVVRRALGACRDARIHPAQLAHREGRDDQGAAQAVLQPAQEQEAPGLDERGGENRGRERPQRV